MARSFFAFISLLAAAASAADVETFTIKTLAAQMRYDVTELVISPGASVKIIFENTDDMPHNLVCFQPGTDVVAVCNQQMEKPDEALKRDWLPEDPRMWLHSKMLKPKEREEITFKAPQKPGNYPFVCTSPGHAMSMQGRLKIAPPGPKLTGMHFAMYLGDWTKLPDFATLKPHREGELDGLVELQLDDYKNQFGVVYTGKLKAPKDDEYTFAIAGDDGVRLSIDGKEIVKHDGIHPSDEIREGKVKLTPGEHDFRLEYFQAAGNAEVYVAWRGADFALTPLSRWVHPSAKAGAPKLEKDETTGMPLLVGKEPIIYRNFITGAGNRSIGVGYPGGYNLAWSAEPMNVVYLWRGLFIDAARHWLNRGGGAQTPLGYDVLRLYDDDAPAFATLAERGSGRSMPGTNVRTSGFQWKGYTLDSKRAPIFRYEWNGVKISERFEMEGEAASATGKVVRTLQLEGPIPADAMFRVAAGQKIEIANGGFVVDGGKLTLAGTSYDNRFKVAAHGAKIAGGKALLIPARPQIEVTYTWLATPVKLGSQEHAH